MAKLEGQSIASSYEQLLHVDRDGGGNGTTHVAVKDGKNDNTFALTLATDAVMITSTNRLEFGDDGTYIHQSADGVLDLVSDTEIEINATTIDINATTIDINGAVGIGTSSPTNQGSALHIYQNHATNNTFLTVESDGANASAYVDIDTAANRDGFIRFKEAGTDKASIFNDASADSLVLTDGANSNTVFIKSNSVGIGENSPNQLLHLKATNGSEMVLQRTSGDTSGLLGGIHFGNSDVDEYLSSIYSYQDGATDSAYLSFHTEVTGGAKAERLRIDSSGDLQLQERLTFSGTNGTTATATINLHTNNYLYVTGGTSGLSLTAEGGADKIQIEDGGGSGRILFECTNTQVAKFDTNSRISLSNNDGGATGGTDGTSGNTVFGYLAGSSLDTDTVNNTLYGHKSGTAIDSGDENTAYGNTSLDAATNGSRNTAVGQGALGTHGTLYDCVGIGKGSEVSANGASNQIVIGKGATGVADNSVVLGNASVTDVYMAQDSGATVHADYVLSQGNQNHVANTMSSPYYRFDGADDIITISDNDNLTFTDGFTFSAWVYIEDKAYFPILTKGRYNVNWEYTFRTSDAGKLELYIGNGSTGFYQVLGTTVLTEYKWNHVVVTYNGDSTASNSSFGFYLNGVSDAISYNAGSLSGGIPNAGDNVIIGNYDSQYAEGQIASVQMHNHVLDATEIKELYSGASVPFKYKGANQTEIITNGTFGADSDWTKGTGWSIGSEVATKTNTGSSTHLQQSVSMVKGKTYRISYECTAFTSGQLDLAFNSGGVFPTDDVSGAGTTLTSATIKTIKHTASASYSNVRIYGNDAFAGSVDNVSIVQVGAVAEFDGSSAGAKVWGDKSGNGLHGTITAGATAPTLENTPYDSGTEYEEGTWTPTIVSSGNVTFTAGGGNIGQYVRIGNQVTLNGFVIVNGLNSADATQTITLQGLPYGGRTGTRAAVAFGNNEGMAMTRGDNIQGIIYETNTVINLYVGDTTTNNATNMLGSEWSDDGRTYFTVTYFTD